MRQISRRQNVVPSIDPSGNNSSVQSYVPSVNTYRTPSEQQVGVIQEEIQATLEQVKTLESIISSVDIKVDESDQLQ